MNIEGVLSPGPKNLTSIRSQIYSQKVTKRPEISFQDACLGAEALGMCMIIK